MEYDQYMMSGCQTEFHLLIQRNFKCTTFKSCLLPGGLVVAEDHITSHCDGSQPEHIAGAHPPGVKVQRPQPHLNQLATQHHPQQS